MKHDTDLSARVDQALGLRSTLAPPPPERPQYNERGISPAALLLHETIIRALQMVLNAWKHYVDDAKKRSISNPQE